MRVAPRLCPECSPNPLQLSKGRGGGGIGRRQAEPVTEVTAVGPPREAGGDVFVPGPAPEAWLRPWPGRPADPSLHDDLLPVIDRLISGWRAQLDSASPAPESEAELDLEPLPRRSAHPAPVPNPKEQPMGIRNSGPQAAADPVPPGGWFYDKPLPYNLTAKAEAELDDPEAELEI
jgi:hypothetical protein